MYVCMYVYIFVYIYPQALECFLHIVNTPPAPRTAADVYLQVGHVHELQNQYDQAMEAYTKGAND